MRSELLSALSVMMTARMVTRTSLTSSLTWSALMYGVTPETMCSSRCGEWWHVVEIILVTVSLLLLVTMLPETTTLPRHENMFLIERMVQ